MLFYAAGRHPLAGIAAAFAGVSGGFSANPIPSGIDPLLQGLTQAGAGVLDPTVAVNPLCNWFFTALSSILIIAVGWFLTDKIVEPRLRATQVDGDPDDMPKMETITPAEARGLWAGLAAFVAGCIVLAIIAIPTTSVLRSSPSTVITLSSGQTYEGALVKDAEGVRQKALLLAETGAVPLSPSGAPDKPEILLLQQADGSVRSYDLSTPFALHEGFTAADARSAVVLRESRRGGGTVLIPEGQIASTEQVDGKLTAFTAPIMQMIVPLIFLLFLLPGVVHGYVSGKFENHRDVIKGMAKSMSTMGYYLVMAFFASLFIYSFNKSGIGAWLAVNGAEAIKSAGLPEAVTIVGIVVLCAGVNLLVGSASAKWALLAPIFVPMLMSLGISPDLTQAAYRVGDSTTNIITPLMPYFPLVVAFCQRYVKKNGHRDVDLDDASLLDQLLDPLDAVLARLLGAGDSAGAAGELHVRAVGSGESSAGQWRPSIPRGNAVTSFRVAPAAGILRGVPDGTPPSDSLQWSICPRHGGAHVRDPGTAGHTEESWATEIRESA